MKTIRTGLVLSLGLACTPSQEAVHVDVEVELDASTVADSTNDLGWTVTLTDARIAVKDLQFTILGEMHSDATAWLPGWVIGRAWAHPGHYAGGDVTGELVGDFVFDWVKHDGMKLGTADMLTGDYNGMNFTFRTAVDGDADAGDPMIGHTAYFAGVARKDGVEVMFTAALDVSAGTQMVGAPFAELVEAETKGTIGVQLEATDPVEDRSMFDGLDFAALDDDGDGAVSIEPGAEAHNLFVRTIQSHIHYAAKAE